MNWKFWKKEVIPDVTRATNYQTIFRRDEKLPLEVWTYLVKRRAGFRCEVCHTHKKLQSHHIKPTYQYGKNIMRNGKCLCTKCHGMEKTFFQENSKFHLSLCERFGNERGTTMLYKLWEAKSVRKMERIFAETISQQQLELAESQIKPKRELDKKEIYALAKEYAERKLKLNKILTDPDKFYDWINKGMPV